MKLRIRIARTWMNNYRLGLFIVHEYKTLFEIVLPSREYRTVFIVIPGKHIFINREGMITRKVAR